MNNHYIQQRYKTMSAEITYNTEHVVGMGSQATILSGYSASKEIAVKIFPNNKGGLTSFHREAHVLKAMRKKSGIVEMLGASESQKAIAMKKYPCDLYQYVFEYRAMGRSPSNAKAVLKQICRAVFHLHTSGIAHLDIKPENVLVDIAANKFYLCDFGLCYVGTERGGTVNGIGLIGTPAYMAPEVSKSCHCYDPFAADVFSIGILFYVLLTGMFPNFSSSGRFEYPEGFEVSSSNHELLCGLLNFVPEKRPRIEEILKHPALHESLLSKFTKKAKLAVSRSSNSISQ